MSPFKCNRYLLGVIPAFNNVEDSAAPAAKPKTSAVSPEPQDESMNTIMQEGAKEIMDVLDLITMSYLLFDTKAKGFHICGKRREHMQILTIGGQPTCTKGWPVPRSYEPTP